MHELFRPQLKLEESFYHGRDVVKIAKDLLGKALFTRFNNRIIGGIIVETEAYSYKERGCHAYQGKKTMRNEVMFRHGGHAYVYLCYGIHNLFNVVTNEEDQADAVLIRALEPVKGIEWMKKYSKTDSEKRITSGPGKLTKALGIDRSHNASLLWSKHLWLEDLGTKVPKSDIISSPRIGIDYAGEDALLPWRFTIKGNAWISK
ncbi:DNA-3-methyladenine glycosylase [soil metagenome]